MSHTLAMAKRLQELQRTYRLVVYENGSHSLAENFLEVRREIDRWLDRYLVSRP